MPEKESTKIVGVGLIQGQKYTLCWEKGKCFLPTGNVLLDAMLAKYARDEPEMANCYTIYEDDPMIADYVFGKLFDKLLSYKCNGSYPTLPYEEGWVY